MCSKTITAVVVDGEVCSIKLERVGDSIWDCSARIDNVAVPLGRIFKRRQRDYSIVLTGPTTKTLPRYARQAEGFATKWRAVEHIIKYAIHQETS